MAWRTVVVSNRAKLDLKYGSMVVRRENDILKIHIPEIATLIIESTAVSLTAALMAELIENKVHIIFCDTRRNPVSELIPYYGSHDSSLKIKEQINWDNETKSLVWQEIVSQKISMQRNLLAQCGLTEWELLNKYLSEIEEYDKTNREAHAAKVYFNALFGMGFSRKTSNPTNAALNYGYQILLSMFNREIVSSGYLTQLGIFHSSRFNRFNLSSDFMEPFRPLVDEIVIANEFNEFDTKQKRIMQGLTDVQVIIGGKTQYITNAIRIYSKSIFQALNEQDTSLIREYKK